MAAEHAALDHLARLGVRNLVGWDGRAGIAGPTDAGPHFDLPESALPVVVRGLVADGWRVEAEGRVYRRPGASTLGVRSGIDWFEMHGQVDFDGMTAKLPDLLEAAPPRPTLRAAWGRFPGPVAPGVAGPVRALAELGEAEGDRIRFRPSQALLLDALLAAEQRRSPGRTICAAPPQAVALRGGDGESRRRRSAGAFREYQSDGLGWLHFLRDFRLGGCLADDMGLGKTVQVLALLQSRRTRPTGADGGRKPSLVVAPCSLVFNWIEEAQRFTPNLRVLDYTGSLRKDGLKHLDQYDVLVTTYGTLHRDIGKLKDIHFDYAILDESQAIKNPQQRAKACRLLAADHRLAMTGTPVENHLGELWSLFEFLNPGMLGRPGVPGDLDAMLGPETRTWDAPPGGLRPFILRRTKEQVLTELPEKTEQTLYCDLEGRAAETLQRAPGALPREALGGGGDRAGRAKIHVLEALLRLRQAACHPGRLDTRPTRPSSTCCCIAAGTRRGGTRPWSFRNSLPFWRSSAAAWTRRARLRIPRWPHARSRDG